MTVFLPPIIPMTNPKIMTIAPTRTLNSSPNTPDITMRRLIKPVALTALFFCVETKATLHSEQAATEGEDAFSCVCGEPYQVMVRLPERCQFG